MYRFSDFPPQTIRDSINEVLSSFDTELGVTELSEYVFNNLEINEPIFDEHQKAMQTMLDDMVMAGRLKVKGKTYSLGDTRKNGEEETYHVKSLETPSENVAQLKGNVIVNTIGSEYYPDAWESLLDNRLNVELIPEPQNPYDKNAIAVTINNEIVGHLTRSVAREYFSCITKLNNGGYTLKVDGEVLESPNDKSYKYIQLAMPAVDTIDHYLG